MPDLCHCRCVLSFTKVFVCGESTERSFQPLQTDRQSKTAHLSAHALPSLDHNFPINRYTARSASALATYTAFVIHISSKFQLYFGKEEDVVESQIWAVEQMVGDDCVAVARKTHAF